MSLKFKLISFSLVIVGLVAFVPVSDVFAQQSNGNSENLSIEKQAEQKREEAKKIAEQAKEDAQRAAEQKREEAINQAEAALEQKKLEIKTKTEEQKQKACESVSERLNSNIDNGSTIANKFKTGFDAHLENINNFYSKMGLTSSNYEVLFTEAELAGTNAQTSVDALDSFKFKVDCSNVNASASNVAAFKEAMNKAKNDLNAYRDAIKAFLNDVKVAAETAEKGQQ